jgi:arylsulfatase
MLSEILVERGWNTYITGKWHLCPEAEMNVAAPRRNWPTGRGFERFYGFLGAETNQWYPDLVYDNHPTDQPKPPEDGYHLTDDLTDQALGFIKDAKVLAPDKPFFLYYAPGACHAPHHAPPDWIAKFRGRFDMGYEAIREQTLKRQKQLGIVPPDTDLPPVNPLGTMESHTDPAKPMNELDTTRPWDTLSAEEKALFSRMAEVYAGFLAHADHHIGRLLDYLEETGQRDNTLIILVSDNGASGEGGPNGSVNENKMANGIQDDIAENLAKMADLGSPKTYNHYPTGWAMAFNTPFKMWKRYEFNGGTADPCVIAWPKGIKARGQIRHQYHHAIDIVPTILDVLDVQLPTEIKGYTQSALDGVSMRYSFDDAKAKTTRRTQFYSMLGSRSIWHDGWKAVTTHIGTMGWGDYANDTWELYNTEADRSECHDLAAEHPERLRDLVNLWYVEAGANIALPLDDRGPVEILTTPRPMLSPPRDKYIYYPGTSEVPESQAVNVRNRSYSIGALADIPGPGAQGVLFAHGSRFGGHALYVKEGRLHYVYNFVGSLEQHVTATQDIPTGDNVILSASFEKDGEDPPGTATGMLSLYHGEQKVGEGRIKTQPGKFSIAGEGLCIGRDSGEPVTDDFPGTAPWPFTGGKIIRVQVNVSGKPYIDLEREAVAMMARE